MPLDELTEAVLRNRQLNIKIGNLEKKLQLAQKAFIRIRDETVDEDEAHNIAVTALTNIKFESNSSEVSYPSPELKQQRITVPIKNVPSETNQVVKRGRPPGSKNRPKV